MLNENKVQLGIRVESKGLNDTELDQISRNLYNEIRELEVESVEPVDGRPAPDGTRAVDAMLIGEWVVKLAPAVVPALLAFLKEWITRQPTVPMKIKVKRGRRTVEVEYDPAKTSPAQLKTMVNRLLK